MDHALHDGIADAQAGRPGANAEHLLVPERHRLLALHAERGEQASQRHAAGALDVVVEAQEVVAVPVQQPPRVGVAKVLKLWQGGAGVAEKRGEGGEGDCNKSRINQTTPSKCGGERLRLELISIIDKRLA